MGEANGGERRHHPRGGAVGRAYVMLEDDTTADYAVENLGPGGALLGRGRPLPVGKTVRVVLRVFPIPAVELDARVAWRSEGEEPRHGLEFVALDASIEDAINEAVASILGGELDDDIPIRVPKLASWLP